MRLTRIGSWRAGAWLAAVLWVAGVGGAPAQGVTTTTVQGTVYLANGQPGTGTLQVSWPAFATANHQAVAAGRTVVTIGADGFVSVNLAPNQGASPAGLYYTAVYHLSDGTVSTEYWVVPAAAQAAIAEVRAQVMPSAQAVQTVSKAYVDQSVQQLTQSLLTASGGNLSGPLFLNGDPSQPTQAATKRYVDNALGQALPVSGGVVTGPLTAKQLGGVYQVDQFSGADFGAKLQACLNGLNASYGGTCDARNFSGNLTVSAQITLGTANATVQLPCATVTTAYPLVVTAGTRNVTLHGCALRGASAASGSQGGSVLLYSGSGAAVQVGDAAYGVDTLGFDLDNLVINTTGAPAGATGIAAYRTQEIKLTSLYLLGNGNQTGMTVDGTGNYTGGTFEDLQFGGFGTAVNAIGHQAANGAMTDWVNASTFLRVHINCPLSGGSPVAGTVGINLAQGDGNTFTGGDAEGCATALHLGANAQNNTVVGLRNENSTNQVVADAGSAYNNWITGGTMFTGQLVDNGTRNSFLDTFHRSFNSLNGDWYGSQQDATVTNHYRVGIGTGSERGLLNRYQTDYGYRWTTGLSDATGGAQFYQVLDELNNVYRLSIGQYNHGQASTNNQTVINAAGTGAVVLNGSANAGTGGVVIGAGGATGATVATINNQGNAQFNGTLQVAGPSTFTSSTTVKNGADAEIDAFLWAGATANQKESFIYKDYTGASQWYLVKDGSNNWALNSALGGLDSFKAYQSNNSGDTYINASNATGHIRLNYETGAGAETDIYAGGSAGLVAAFAGTNAIKFPGLAAGSGKNCLQIDNSGYLSNTAAACGAGTVNTGTAGQVAVYAANGTTVAGTSAVGVAAGGTGATSAGAALANLGAQAALPGVSGDGSAGVSVTGAVAASNFSGAGTGLTGTASGLTAAHTQNLPGDFATQSAAAPAALTGTVVTAKAAVAAPVIGGDFYPTGLVADGTVCADVLGVNCTYAGTDNTAAIQGAINAAYAAGGGKVHLPAGVFNILNVPGAPRPGVGNGSHVAALTIPGSNITLEGAGPGQTTLSVWQANADGTITQPTAECPQNPDFLPGTNGGFTYYRVWRGSGIYIYGGTSSAPTANVSIKSLRITGNAAINNWNRNPIIWDQNLSLGAGSVCNAWDTSHKGIYLQNNNFAPGGAGWPNNSAFYPPGGYSYDHISLERVMVDHFLGELVYSGNTTNKGSLVTYSELAYSNGDGTSVGGGWTMADNKIHDVSAHGHEDSEDTANGYTLSYLNNEYWNVQGVGISVGAYVAPGPNAKVGKFVMQGNRIDNAAGNGIAVFSGLHGKISGNQIFNSGWATPYTSAAIVLYGMSGFQSYSGAPAAPAAPQVAAGTGGSLAAGTYMASAAWTFPGPASLGFTAASGQVPVTVAANGTVTFTQPANPPANANGWYPYLCLNAGGGCAGVLQLTQNNSAYPPIALATTTYTVSGLGPLTQTAQSAGQTYTPTAQDIDISNNTIEADAGTTWVGVSLTNLVQPLNYPFANNIGIRFNTFANTGLYAKAGVSAPATAPTLSQPANNTGQTAGFYPNLVGQTLYAVYTWLTPQCETPASPQASIAMGSTSGISNLLQTAVSGAPSGVVGYNVYVGTASGGPYYLQTSSGWRSLAAPWTMSAGLVTSGATPPTWACNGVVFNHAVDTPANINVAGSAVGYSEQGNIANNTVQAYGGGTAFKAASLNAGNLGSSTGQVCADGSGNLVTCTNGIGTNATVASATLTNQTSNTGSIPLYTPTVNHTHLLANCTVRTTTAGTAGTAACVVGCGNFSSTSGTAALSSLGSNATMQVRATWNTGDGGCYYSATFSGNVGGAAQVDAWVVTQ